MTKLKHGIFNVAMLLLSVALVLAVFEAGMRIHQKYRPKKIPIMKVVDEPFIFGLNPNHPEINSHGLRNDEITLSRPKDVFRILILGDSVAFGEGLKKQDAFPDRLQSFLKTTHPHTEVLNASALGYTTYNELQYYISKGRAFQPNLVIVAFCLNDVADPRLHWSFAGDKIKDIPLEAIPNIQYDLEHAIPIQLPLLRRYMPKERSDSFLEASLLYRTVAKGINRIISEPKKSKYPCSAIFNGKTPTHLTTEDSISIEVLMDDSSPEWMWLTSMFSQLNEAVVSDSGKMVIVLFPLAYQLDDSYPYIPQKRIEAHCSRQGILCVDLLSEFRKWDKATIFRFNNAKYCDIWHLTPLGHHVAAKALAEYLTKNHLIADTIPTPDTKETYSPPAMQSP